MACFNIFYSIMKKWILSIVFLFCLHLLTVEKSIGQVNFGVRGGINYPGNLSFDRAQLSGFHVGTYMKISLLGIVAVEPGLQYVHTKDKQDSGDRVNHNYLNLPVVARFSIFPAVNLFAGPQFSYLFGNGQQQDPGMSLPSESSNFIPGALVGLGVNLPLGFNLQGSYDFNFSKSDIPGSMNPSLIKLSIGKNF